MPRYHLHLHNILIDAEDVDGHDLPDIAAARALAIDGIRDFIGHEAFGGKVDFRGRIDIADADDNLLESVAFGDAFEFHAAPPRQDG